MLTSEIIVIVVGTLLFFGFAVFMAIYSSRKKQNEESENGQSPQAENMEFVEPKPVAADRPREVRAERKIAANPRFTSEGFKSTVEILRRSNQTIGVRNRKTLSRSSGIL